MKSLHIATVALLLCVPALVAQTQPAFTDADLEGTWAFQQTHITHQHPATGTFTADGLGNLAGVRNMVVIGGPGRLQSHILTGTYVVNADGTGSASLTSSPPVLWGTGEENISFVMASADRLFFAGSTEQSPNTARQNWGEAIRQRQPDEEDEIEIRLEELELLSCELVRLLLTPQGQRFSDCCNVPMDFPDGKDAPSCGGTVVTSPSPVPPPAPGMAPPRQR